MSERIKWIDYLKGLTIIGVIFVHAPGHYEWWTANHVNTLFFFMAGIFFKDRPFKEFVKRHFWSLVITFIILFLLSYPFRIIVNLWDTRSLEGVQWNMIFDIFKVEARSDYLYSNVPLWFLLCIFWVQIFYYGIFRLPKFGQVLVLVSIWLLWDIITQIPTPFMMNNALCFTLYFGLGNLLGKFIVKVVENRGNSVAIIVIGVLVMFLIDYFLENNSQTSILFYVCWCLVMLASFSFLQKVPYLDWLGFFGTNTLVILGTHVWVLIPLGRISYRFTRMILPEIAIILTIVTALLMILLIKTINRHFPIIAGKYKNN